MKKWCSLPFTLKVFSGVIVAVVGCCVLCATNLLPAFAPYPYAVSTSSDSAEATDAGDYLSDIITTPVSPMTPTTLTIPTLNLTANIVGLGVNEQGEFAAPNNASEVGWYIASGYPGIGDPQQAILLDGHLTDQRGQPAIFADLASLPVGANFTLARTDGITFEYEVTSVATVPHEQVDMSALVVSADPAKEGVTIITCAGDFTTDLNTYNHRLVVTAVSTN